MMLPRDFRATYYLKYCCNNDFSVYFPAFSRLRYPTNFLSLKSSKPFSTMRNVEIKAKVHNIVDLIEKARNLTGDEPEIIKQNDIFFNVAQGRLKLRKFEDGSGDLIYYERPDTEGPKLSSYEKTSVKPSDLNPLYSLLTAALGEKCVVNKMRKLFLIGQTRLHVDSVDGLGDFMELEVVLRDEQSPEEGQQIAFDLMEKLGIDSSDLMATAYADLLNSH